MRVTIDIDTRKFDILAQYTLPAVRWLYSGIRVCCFELARNRLTKIQILHRENEFIFDRAMALFEFINQPPGFGKSYINDYLTCFTIDPVGPRGSE